MLYKNVKKHQNTFAKPNGVNKGKEKEKKGIQR
jgi:hypothetical protein